jgi:hypothetical protein
MDNTVVSTGTNCDAGGPGPECTVRVPVKTPPTPPRSTCPVVVKLVTPKPKKAGNRLLVKRITTNTKCKTLKPIVICRPIGSSAAGETAFCVTKLTKRGRIRVKTGGYDTVRVRVVVRAKPKPKLRAQWKANTWRGTWILR